MRSTSLAWSPVVQALVNGRRRPSRRAVALYRRGDIVDQLECSRLGHSGKGVCMLEASESTRSLIVLCDDVLPGEIFQARITKVHVSYLEAVREHTLRKHRNAVQAPCPYAGACGGCTLQTLEYRAQVESKRERLLLQLRHAVGFAEADKLVQPALECDQPLGYRNKTTFHYDPTGSQHCLGLHAPGSNHTVHVAACLLQSDAANAVLQDLDALLATSRLTAYKPSSNTGFLKSVSIRQGVAAVSARQAPRQPAPSQPPPLCPPVGTAVQQDAAASDSCEPVFLINFVTAAQGTRAEQEALHNVASSVVARHADVHGVVHSLHTSRNTSAPSSSSTVLHGSGHLHCRIQDLLFRVSSESFFQVNTRQAGRLFDAVLAGASLRPSDNVLDLYCGTGSIALFAARHCRRVVGVEVTEAAVQDARTNASLNGIANAEFHQCDLTKQTGRLRGLMASPDVVVVDPARAGLSSELVEYLRVAMPRRVVYVSCNAQTMCRDLKLLCDTGSKGAAFDLLSVLPVDMFPQTHHLEAVAVLVSPTHEQ